MAVGCARLGLRTKLVTHFAKDPNASTEPVEVSAVLAPIDVLAKHPRTAVVQVEYRGMKSSPGYMGVHRGMYDQLAHGRERQTVADILKTMRRHPMEKYTE